jgi:hypothetical protein
MPLFAPHLLLAHPIFSDINNNLIDKWTQYRYDYSSVPKQNNYIDAEISALRSPARDYF